MTLAERAASPTRRCERGRPAGSAVNDRQEGVNVLARIWQWWMEPFRTNVDIYEHTRIEWRLFPPKISVRALPQSLQEAIDEAVKAGGGTVSIRPGRIHLVEPVSLSGSDPITLRDMYLRAHGEAAIKIDGLT